jgi:hypothetical protein
METSHLCFCFLSLVKKHEATYFDRRSVRRD